MSHRAPSTALAVALTAIGLSACGTQDIDPNHVLLAENPSPDRGGLAIVFPPTDDSYAAQQARAASHPNLTQYHVIMDGDLLAYDPGGGMQAPFAAGEGVVSNVCCFPGGAHHFTIAALGSAPIFDGDGDIAADGTTALFLFGAIDALGGRFVDMPNTRPDGIERINVVNLMRSGQQIEVVSCTDAATCVPIGAGPLSAGDVFSADLPATVELAAASTFGANGAGYGYRQVPSASAPNPPLIPLFASSALTSSDFWGAPVYLSADGVPQMVF